MNLTCVIEEAKTCSANYAAEYAEMYSTGIDSEELMFKVTTLNAAIRTLERFMCQRENFYNKKEKCLPLGTSTWVRHHGVCLNGDDVEKIIENIKILCSNCNCNCN